MAVFKCKMCGGTLEINNESVAVCEYCGAQQTLPKLDNERRINLYDRANHFRRNNDFDKAMGIYEQILNEDRTDAEAYWSLVLCRYGIEYVEDPATHKRMPTINRAQYTSIFDDDNYKSALQYADIYQHALYEQEANTINEIQKGILAISQKEEPFDIFICYKETDNGGRRTHDSVLANDLYHQLTQEGFKVFFSRITLEDKLGTAYEPYIFAALNSAKVMVVLGTRPEFFNAVWVKNEWSRFLGLIKNGAEKVLIPAYRDMDPYDLPEEFSHLQAQDMSKLGFMQDLIRGIKKIAQSEPAKQVVQENVVVNSNASIDPLLRRAFMFLEDGNWNDADEYCERVLDIDPECAKAYLGKLMAQFHVHKQESLKDCEQVFDQSINYRRAMQFADDDLRGALNGYIDHINLRNEETRIYRIYSHAKQMIEDASTEEAYTEAASMFESIMQYKDSKEYVIMCREKAVLLRNAQTEERKKCDLLLKEIQKLDAEKENMQKREIGLREKLERLEHEKDNLGFLAFKRERELEEEIQTIRRSLKSIPSQLNTMQSQKMIFIQELEGYVIGRVMAKPYRRIAQLRQECKIGNYVKFGSYKQKGVASEPEDIEWLVLDIKDGKALLLSRYGLEFKQYEKEETKVDWEKSAIRFWLNNEFKMAAFSAVEQTKIMVTALSNDNGYSNHPTCKNTWDRVFLLSYNEADKYRRYCSERRCETTTYARELYKRGAVSDVWWLRLAGFDPYYVKCFGTTREETICATNIHCAVRPAIWVDLN